MDINRRQFIKTGTITFAGSLFVLSCKASYPGYRISTRAFGNESQNFTPMSKDDFRNAVIQERRLEFVNEDNRWYDLVRTGTFVQQMKDHSAYESGVAESNKIDIAENIKDTHVLFPIPQREIDLNPALTQNPGY